THPGWPGLHDNQAWVASDPTSACRVDGLYGNYGKTWRRHFTGYKEAELTTLPKVTTETGVTLGGPITEEVQACLYLSLYLDQFERGWAHTAVYLLRDRTDEGGNQTFGFYKPDYSPRRAATYLHNLTTILADNSWSNAPGKLDYTIPGRPETVHDMLLQKKGGNFALVIWDERFMVGTDEIKVELANTPGTVEIFDPTTGSSPLRRAEAGGSISLTLSNHPVVLELKTN
ncbi:MAG: glycosyl hydrolase, partial [Limisphaerales bacterium]